MILQFFQILYARSISARTAGLVFLFLPFLGSPLVAQRDLKLIYPNGGEVFTAGEIVQVEWTSTGFDPGERVELEYSTDGGSDWRNIDKTTAGAGGLSWEVPNRPSTTAMVRISSRDGDISDASDSFFEIKENPLDRTLMIAPNGGEVMTSGDEFLVQWQVPLDAIEATVELSTDFGITWTEVGTFPAAIAEYRWQVPERSSEEITSAVMRVSVTEAPDHFDISDAPFTIRPKATEQPSLTLTFPNGGEKFVQDTTLVVRWNSTNIPGDVEVEYSPDNGVTWKGIGTVFAPVGAVSWKTPGEETTTGLIRVRTKDGVIEDRSNSTFFILLPPAQLSVREHSPLSGLSIYPNPATTELTIASSGSGLPPIGFELLDLQGRLVISFDEGELAGKHQIRANVQHLSPGIYSCRVRTSEGIQTEQIIIYR